MKIKKNKKADFLPPDTSILATKISHLPVLVALVVPSNVALQLAPDHSR